MSLPSALDRASREGRLLVVWGAPAFPLSEHPPANRAQFIQGLATNSTPTAAPLTALPPVPILSLDASDRVERAFEVASLPLQVVCSRRDVPARGQHVLLKLAGDLAARSGVVLSRAELRSLHNDADKRHLLDEARRVVKDGAMLLVGCDFANADFLAWWDVLAPALRADWFALGDPQAAWPQGVTCLGAELELPPPKPKPYTKDLSDDYFDLQIRIQAFDAKAQAYPVEALLGNGAHFSGGWLRLDEVGLRSIVSEPQKYGLELFDALFSGLMTRR